MKVCMDQTICCMVYCLLSVYPNTQALTQGQRLVWIETVGSINDRVWEWYRGTNEVNKRCYLFSTIVDGNVVFQWVDQLCLSGPKASTSANEHATADWLIAIHVSLGGYRRAGACAWWCLLCCCCCLTPVRCSLLLLCSGGCWVRNM